MNTLPGNKKDYSTYTHWDSGVKGKMIWITDQMPVHTFSADQLNDIFKKHDFFNVESYKDPMITSSFLSDFFKRSASVTKIVEFRFPVADKSEWGFEFNFI